MYCTGLRGRGRKLSNGEQRAGQGSEQTREIQKEQGWMQGIEYGGTDKEEGNSKKGQDWGGGHKHDRERGGGSMNGLFYTRYS